MVQRYAKTATAVRMRESGQEADDGLSLDDHFIAALFSDTGPFRASGKSDALGANTVTEFRFGVFAD